MIKVGVDIGRYLAIICVVLGLYSCSQYQKDGAPGGKIALSEIKPITAKYEPISRGGNSNPYTVLGKTYQLLPSNKAYKETGIASWYGTKFHGNKTANGEIYDMRALSAAHRSLPIPTYLKVTNLSNHRSVVVRVNDRGPFHSERIIDLSYGAAAMLGFVDKGTASVLLESIDFDNAQTDGETNTQAAIPKQAKSTAHYLQVGAFSNQLAAQKLKQQVTKWVDQSVEIRELAERIPTLYRVFVGPFSTMDGLTLAKQNLNALGVKQSHRVFISD